MLHNSIAGDARRIAPRAVTDNVAGYGAEMETTKAEGTLREAAGTVKETVGSLTGDAGLQLEGKVDELRGKAQQLCADATDLAREAMASSPLAILAGVTVFGFVAGVLWAGRRDSDD